MLPSGCAIFVVSGSNDFLQARHGVGERWFKFGFMAMETIDRREFARRERAASLVAEPSPRTDCGLDRTLEFS